MLQEMFGPKVANDFLKGIQRFSNALEVDEEKVQIRLTLTQQENQPIKYELNKDWRVVRETNFKEIMGLKIDLLNYEGLLNPVIIQMMVFHGQNLSIRIEALSAYLFKKGNQVGVAIYDGSICSKVSPIQEMLKME
jgi:hypothetical protein